MMTVLKKTCFLFILSFTLFSLSGVSVYGYFVDMFTKKTAGLSEEYGWAVNSAEDFFH